MELNIYDNSKPKYVSIWLTREESNNPRIEEMIKNTTPKWKAKGYKVVVFHSGTESLLEVTKNLLLHQLRLQAEEKSADSICTNKGSDAI